MVLTDVDGTIVWATNTSSTKASSAALLNSGNLIITNSSGSVLWQSFDSPTDTILPSQPITKDVRLTSTIGDGSLSTGYYSLYFDNDNVLRLIYNGPETSSIYWPDPAMDAGVFGRTTFNSTRFAVLDDVGRFMSSDAFGFNASDLGLGIRRRLTMDYDGNLRLYSLNESDGSWSVTWMALSNMCKVHGLCGRNGICIYEPGLQCSCPPYYEMTNKSDWTKGCKPTFNLTCDPSHQKTTTFIELPHSDFWGYDYTSNTNSSFDSCKNTCLSDCTCQAFRYGLDRKCFAKSALFDGYSSPEFWGDIYLKIPATLDASNPPPRKLSNLTCNTSESKDLLISLTLYVKTNGKTKWVYYYGFLSAFGVIEFLFITFGWWALHQRRESAPITVDEGYRIITSQFRRFTYGELKKATRNFNEELGRGGSGAVYKGILGDKRTVAVKRLEDVTQGEEDDEFWSEVSTIGRINHMNLVRMYGFCSEPKHRLLVCEYVEYGSLDGLLFDDDNDPLRWRERFKIAVGTAKGLAYLHHECLEWVVHCDIKPENILIDRNYEAKIADFGLMKLSQRGAPTTELSRIRGTKGYMAPEWVLNLPITAKVDVYSFGVVLLEMLRGRRIFEWEVDMKSLIRVEKERLANGDDSWIEDLVDARLNGDVDVKQAETMALIAFLCVEEEAGKRPTMDKVVETLMAVVEVDCETITVDLGEQ
ncbi:putative receptor protein kinase ZmPK1 [Acorus gramineus]|uniref:Receptor-like serine/threonine-protein kinase n=1 Tax=Acorus gramineus TaxID=55184 RepID=A0AAV9BM07_ACOGR|nr:putative receptor protein kinase ZmPK1 [Acorus gramineus]